MKFKLIPIAAALFGAVTMASAQDFPDSAVTWIVNWPAGGGQDTTSRMVAEALSAELGVPVVVENYDGAGGLVGMRKLASADADGYTIGMLGSSSVIQQYTADEAVMMDELAVLSFFGPDPAALTVQASSPHGDLMSFVMAAKEEPMSVINGNDPPGGGSYIAAAILESQLELQLTKVPYKGYAPTVTGLLGGEVQSATVPVPQVIEYARNGDMRILGVMAENRHFLAPDVPTFKELGFDVTAGDFRAVVGPAGIPEDRMRVLTDALVAVLSDPAFVEKANAAGYMIEPLGAGDAAARIATFDAQVYPVLEGAELVTHPR